MKLVNGKRCKFSEDVTSGLSIYFMKTLLVTNVTLVYLIYLGLIRGILYTVAKGRQSA